MFLNLHEQYALLCDNECSIILSTELTSLYWKSIRQPELPCLVARSDYPSVLLDSSVLWLLLFSCCINCNFPGCLQRHQNLTVCCQSVVQIYFKSFLKPDIFYFSRNTADFNFLPYRITLVLSVQYLDTEVHREILTQCSGNLQHCPLSSVNTDYFSCYYCWEV